MSRIIWDGAGSRLYETGIDRGVLYVDGQPGIPWNGLTSIVENSPGGLSKSYYLDGEKYVNLATREEFQATLTAYTYPDQFEPCNGISSVRTGLLITKQIRKSFGMSYRTMVGNDKSSSYGYKIHILYNLLASPANKTYKSIGTSNQIDDFSWTLTSLPPVQTGYLRSSHVIIDSLTVDPQVLTAVETILYGDDSTAARLPSLSELSDLVDTFDSFIVTDNGDGTVMIAAPIDDLFMLDDSIVQMTWSTVTYIDDNTISITSSTG